MTRLEELKILVKRKGNNYIGVNKLQRGKYSIFEFYNNFNDYRCQIVSFDEAKSILQEK